MLRKRKNHIPWPADNIPPNAAQDTISPLCCQGMLLLAQDSEVLFCKAVFKVVATQVMGLLLGRAFCFHFLNFMRFLLALWMATQPSDKPTTHHFFVLSANLSHHPDHFMLMFWVIFFHCPVSFRLSVHLLLALLCSQNQGILFCILASMNIQKSKWTLDCIRRNRKS